MSKSKKKQKARERAREASEGLESTIPAAPQEVVPEVTPPAPATAKAAQPLNQALFDRVVAAATRAGQMREEGERMSYVYNGESVAMKYVEGDDQHPARILVAAFRQGVVFQVEGDRQVVYQPGAWELELDKLEAAADDEEDDDAPFLEDDEPDDDEATGTTPP